jgi:hypothetical protein
LTAVNLDADVEAIQLPCRGHQVPGD